MRFSYVLFIALFMLGCQEPKDNETTTFVEELPIEKEDSVETPKEVLKEEDKLGKPIWGYRFILVGDFDGNNQQDTLMERFVDVKTKQETNKFFENVGILDYQDNKVGPYEYYSYMASNTLEDTFTYLSAPGIAYSETIGDIDGDGADEIGILADNADMSSVNTYRIYTYKNGWKLYYSFEVRDWEFPALPEHNTIYGMFGAMDQVFIEDSTQNQAIEEALEKYQRVKIVAPNTIEYAAFGVGDCEIHYKYKTYEDSIIWVVPEFPIEDKKIVSVWTEYELYPKETVEMIQIQQDSIEICDPASLFRQRVQFKKYKSSNHLVQ